MERMEIKEKKILVTGGAGFIGGNLVEELINQGAKVSVIDIKINPKSLFFTHNLKKKVDFTFLDIRDKPKIKKYLKVNSPEFIFHLAAEPIVERAYDNPLAAFETNIIGTVNLLEEIRQNKKIKGIIVASSDKAYGKTKSAYTEEPTQKSLP
ncbi:MAG: SDR family NAD(P)-dependent oxidoreductase [Actinobacteria bacterium]|nr:SDR family NAD(P)-dependent oxidoreductase [Actinomycetota bacterium]